MNQPDEQQRYIELSAKLHQLTQEYGHSDSAMCMLIMALGRLDDGSVDPSVALMARYYMQCHLDMVNRLVALPCSDSIN